MSFPISISRPFPCTPSGGVAELAYGALNALTALSHNGGGWWSTARRGAARDRDKCPKENRVSLESPGDSQAARAHGPNDESGAWDRQCVIRTRHGDSAAFGLLVDHYASRIYAHLYRLVGSREEAEDLAQETFLRAYRYLDRYDTSRVFRTWLYTIATNTGLNALRTRRRQGDTVPLDELYPLSDAKVEEGWRVLEREERRDTVAKAIEKLSPRSALLIDLHYREGMTLREAGEIVGMSEGAAKVALLRARRALREWLVEGGENS